MALWVKVKVTWLYGKGEGKGNMALWVKVKVKVTWLSGKRFPWTWSLQRVFTGLLGLWKPCLKLSYFSIVH